MTSLAELGEISKRDEQRKRNGTHKWVTMMNDLYSQSEDQMLRTIERAAKDKRYQHIGNEVYHRNRRLFPTQGRVYADQHVKENKGSNTKVYVRSRHPNPMLGGMTYTTRKSPNAYVEGFPTWSGKPHKQLRNQAFAAHEHQHVRDFAGSPKQREAFKEAVRSTMRKYPKAGWLKETFVRGPQRNIHFGEQWQEHTGVGEGRADAAAARSLRVPVRGISGYPNIANFDPNFKRGYERGGGKSGTNWEIATDRREFKNRAKARAKNAKQRRS